MEKTTNLTKSITALVAFFLFCLISAAVLMYAWNTIAWEFNLPQFNYFTCFCAYYSIRTLFFPVNKKGS